MDRKSQGLSMNVIIIAAIALIILVVLIAIFTGRIGVFSTGIADAGSCISRGGDCQPDPCGDGQEGVLGALGCTEETDGKYCCKDASESGVVGGEEQRCPPGQEWNSQFNRCIIPSRQ